MGVKTPLNNLLLVSDHFSGKKPEQQTCYQ